MLPVPENGGFEMEGYWVWCGSVVKGEDGRYHMFASRWSREYPMHPGWLLKSEIVHAVSDTYAGPFKYCDTVISERGAEFWDGRMAHNPHIVKTDNGYCLFYTGTTYHGEVLPSDATLGNKCVIEARAGKRIGTAFSRSVYGPWERQDAPCLPTRQGMADSYLTTNPAPCIKDDGSVMMIYKGRAYVPPEVNPYRYGGMTLLRAEADSVRSPFRRDDDNTVWKASRLEIEDPFLWFDGGYHMIAKDMTGEICGEKYGGIYAFSADGKDWSFKENCVFYSRNVLTESGRRINLGNMERPFILFEDGRPVCAYFAVSDGKDGMGFLNCTRTWNMAIPLDAEKNMGKTENEV